GGYSAINGDFPDPFKEVINALERSGMDPDKARSQLSFTIANSSAVSYLHIGRPETILIDDTDRVRNQLDKFDS
uniref:hypothetical protein n=1 Tax=Methylobacterium sp. B34 TaxID=95563 RepID=UPI0011AE29E2